MRTHTRLRRLEKSIRILSDDAGLPMIHFSDGTMQVIGPVMRDGTTHEALLALYKHLGLTFERQSGIVVRKIVEKKP